MCNICNQTKKYDDSLSAQKQTKSNQNRPHRLKQTKCHCKILIPCEIQHLTYSKFNIICEPQNLLMNINLLLNSTTKKSWFENN